VLYWAGVFSFVAVAAALLGLLNGITGMAQLIAWTLCVAAVCFAVILFLLSRRA
jgi:hypothetical protein